MKKLRYYILVPIFLMAFYFVGPSLDKSTIKSDLPNISYEGADLDRYVNERERGVFSLKEDNQARIVWFDDSLKEKTEYAIVYLHGFSGSQGEGYPVHVNFAKRFGCNLYLSRLYDHGIYEDDALYYVTPENLMKSAAQAIAIGKQLGDKVILMSTSTGGTLSLYMAANHPDLHALILYSPNIKINNPFTFLLTGPWGIQIGQVFAGGQNFVYKPESWADSLYWTQSYRVEAVGYMQRLLDMTMKRNIFIRVKQPVFMGYYYKNDEEQDETVSVEAMLKMFNALGTPKDKKVKKAFPDAGRHVIASEYFSGDWKGVQESTYEFAEDILGMTPVE